MSDLVGTVISGKYELKKFLGEGGLGRVFLAQQRPLGRKVALKLLHPELSCDASIVSRFEREALAASKVSHPNSVVIHDFGSDTIGSTQQLYLVMEFLSGETLHDRIQKQPKRRLQAREAVSILSQVLRPLGAFHKAGVIHRDLKPDNIMLCQNDMGEQVKLLDFGIAKVSGVSLTATGQMVGTPFYMSPEQIMASKDLGPGVDIYAMGILLFESLTGEPPYLSEHHIDLFRMHLKEQPKSLLQWFPNEPHLAPFDTVIRKAMSKKAQDRYSNTEELRQAMEDALLTSEKMKAQQRPTPPWWIEPNSTTKVMALIEEESTDLYEIAEHTLITQIPSIEETVKMPQLLFNQLSEDWPMSDNPLPTEPLVKPETLNAHSTWVQRVGVFWKRVSTLWKVF